MTLSPRVVTSRVRVSVCTIIAAIAGHFTLWSSGVSVRRHDFAQVWYAAGAVLQGQDPYALIGPGRAFEWQAPLFYPLPAALVALPVAPLSEAWAMSVFAALSAGLLAWALTEHGFGPLLGITSLPALQALYIGQWSPVLAGALVLAPLAVVLIAKPTIGIAVFVARPSWWAVLGAAVLAASAFLVQPHWLSEWRQALSMASVGAGKRFPYLTPVTLRGGILVLAALSRWRRPEARLLIAMAMVPQTMLPYEGVLLLLIPRSWAQATILSAASWGMDAWVHHELPHFELPGVVLAYGPLMVLTMYLPATLMVLRRPNEGMMPAWFEHRIACWPMWLRGRAVASTHGSEP